MAITATTTTTTCGATTATVITIVICYLRSVILVGIATSTGMYVYRIIIIKIAQEEKESEIVGQLTCNIGIRYNTFIYLRI